MLAKLQGVHTGGAGNIGKRCSGVGKLSLAEAHRRKTPRGAPEFTMNVTGQFRGDAMLRQITESVLINHTPPDKLIDNKTEWNHAHIPHAGIV